MAAFDGHHPANKHCITKCCGLDPVTIQIAVTVPLGMIVLVLTIIIIFCHRRNKRIKKLLQEVAKDILDSNKRIEDLTSGYVHYVNKGGALPDSGRAPLPLVRVTDQLLGTSPDSKEYYDPCPDGAGGNQDKSEYYEPCPDSSSVGNQKEGEYELRPDYDLPESSTAETQAKSSEYYEPCPVNDHSDPDTDETRDNPSKEYEVAYEVALAKADEKEG